VIAKASLRRVLNWVQRVLFAGGLLMLGYCGFVLFDVTIFQHRETDRLESLLNERRQTGNASPQAATASSMSPASFAGPDGLIGRIKIARLGISVVVVEGTGKRTLRRAAGHIEGTALPGQPGNVAISAHRDTFFRPLRNVKLNDIVALTTPNGEYRYRVISTKVVKPSDVSVLNSDGNEILTLITCYPFYFVGAAPDRFIVRAERVL